MKSMKWIFSFVILLGAVVFLASCATSSNAQEDTYLTLDINPSIELIVTPREKVVYANPLNEDGEILLAELDLIGMQLDDAMDLIIETAIELGYIDVDAEETFVQVSSVAKNTEIGDKIRERAKEHINNAFKDRMMMGRAEDKGFTPEFLAEAESYGVTPGFLFLAQKAVIASDELLLEDALLMTVQELQAILKEARQDMRVVAQALREEFLTARQALYDTYYPQMEEIRIDIAAKEAELETLQANLLAKQAELTEALEENKATIEAEIAAIEADILVVEGEIQALLSSLESIREEFHAAVTSLREAYLVETEQLRAQIREMFEHRHEVHAGHAQEVIEERRQQRDEIRERIENWQKNRP